MSSANQRETAAEGRDHWFATTHWSVVLTARQASSPNAEAALEKLCRAYWYPLYAYIRWQGRWPQDAQDLTQEFFARFLEGNYLRSVQREKGKFRSFLLASLNHFLANEHARVNAAKRGGGKTLLSLDEDIAEELFALDSSTPDSPAQAYDKRWAITLLERAFAHVREEFAAAGKQELFDQLKCFLAEDTSAGDYAVVAERLGMTAGSVTVAVHRLRHKYREATRAEVAHTVANVHEIDDEIRYLFKVLAQ
jgi:DNA-directed RNA polymerase specialized sigma24 family protein